MNKEHIQAMTEQRTNEVIQLVTMGMSYSMIYEYAKDKEWNIGKRQIDNYIKKANDYFKSISDVKREEAYGLLVDRYRDLYFKSQRIKDYKTCSQINDKLAKLLGFEQMKDVLSVNVVVNNVPISDEAIKKHDEYLDALQNES